MAGNQLITLQTQGAGLYQITPQIAQAVRRAALRDGLLTLFIQHTSASLLIQENADPEVQTDLHEFFKRLVPDSNHPAMRYLTHTYEGPDDMPAHIKAALMPTSLSIPIQDGRMALGTWQGIYVFEHRTAPHTRRIALNIMGP